MAVYACIMMGGLVWAGGMCADVIYYFFSPI